MPKQRFDPDLVSEMEWSECIYAASLKPGPDVDPRESVWICASCAAVLTLVNHRLLSDLAQEFLDRGWRYRRIKTKVANSIDAVCGQCRNTHK